MAVLQALIAGVDAMAWMRRANLANALAGSGYEQVFIALHRRAVKMASCRACWFWAVYTGSGVLGSAGHGQLRTKQVERAGIPTPPFTPLRDAGR
jgi:hypothetical protein